MKIVFQSKAHYTRIHRYADLLLWPGWPLYTKLTLVFRRCTRVPKMKFLGKSVKK